MLFRSTGCLDPMGYINEGATEVITSYKGIEGLYKSGRYIIEGCRNENGTLYIAPSYRAGDYAVLVNYILPKSSGYINNVYCNSDGSLCQLPLSTTMLKNKSTCQGQYKYSNKSTLLCGEDQTSTGNGSLLSLSFDDGPNHARLYFK